MDFDIPRYPVNYYRSINNFFIQYQYPIALYRLLPFEQERFLKGNYMNYIYYSPFSSLISKDYFRYLFDLDKSLVSYLTLVYCLSLIRSTKLSPPGMVRLW